MPSINSYKLFLFAILICSILNLTGDIKAQSFDLPNFEEVDTSMSKTVVSFHFSHVLNVKLLLNKVFATPRFFLRYVSFRYSHNLSNHMGIRSRNTR